MEATDKKTAEWIRPSSPFVGFITSPGCATCRAVRPHVDTLADEYRGKVSVVEVDATTQPDVARALKAKATPTLIAISNGHEVSRLVGSAEESDIRSLFTAAEAGRRQGSHRISTGERRIRLLAAVITGAVGLASGTWWLLGVAVVLLGAAVYDLRPRSTASTTVDAAEAIGLLGSDKAPVLVDVRSAGERASQYIPGSIHVPLDTYFESSIVSLDSDTGYLLYCATGIRSGRAVRALQKSTITQVGDIKGGIGAWVSSGGTFVVAALDQNEAAR